MISYSDIINKAERKYNYVLRAWLVDDIEAVFPIEFPVGRLSKNLTERRKQIDHLRKRSKEQSERGYALQWKTVNKRDLSTQTVPHRIVIESLEDYLGLLQSVTEFRAFTEDVAKIRHKFPQLGRWLQANPKRVIEYHGEWDDLLKVCDYFVKHPRPNVYIRELPIQVHTKFIESHISILRDLLDCLLPDDAINIETTDFNARFGLKNKPTLVRLRALEEQLEWQFRLELDDITLPVKQLAHLLNDHLKPKRVIVVENLINFLTLPKLPTCVGLFGGGSGVSVLRDVDWLNHCDILYWGDIDAHGFQILSDLRKIFPHVRSVMMDRQTIDVYSQYLVEGKQTHRDDFAGLTQDELDFLRYLQKNNLRLEQEHIPHSDAVGMLRQAL